MIAVKSLPDDALVNNRCSSKKRKVTREYLLVMIQEEREALGSVRCLTNLQVAEDNYLYVRGIGETELADKRIKQLPVLHSYVLDEE